ncbi:hypothetical protein [Amycolatopsis sp. lyj-23]|uniref:hypothetical protein n=1 Tax=Amycolatopsis sp. lyj-23 TaxID=2789283 RepID=UPI003978163B
MGAATGLTGLAAELLDGWGYWAPARAATPRSADAAGPAAHVLNALLTEAFTPRRP